MKALMALVTLTVCNTLSAMPLDCERLTPSDAAVLTRAQLQKRYCDADRAHLRGLVAVGTALKHLGTAYESGGGPAVTAAEREEKQAYEDVHACLDAWLNIDKLIKEKGGSTDAIKCKP